MPHYWRLQIEIKGFDVDRLSAITEAARKHWQFGVFTFREDISLTADGEGTLDRIDQDDWADAIAREIWQVNESFCPITVKALWLDDPDIKWLDTCQTEAKGELPYCPYEKDESDYQRVMGPDFTNEIYKRFEE